VEDRSHFVRDHYGAIYGYLLHLTGQPELAKDLTQETFLEGWRCLDTFEGRGSLRSWLHRIAHRQFVRVLQRQREERRLHGMAELPAPDATAWLESVELRDAIDRLPLEQREVVLLHYLEGYSSSEIAPIVEVPASTVRRRLAQARDRLRQELGEDDLTYLNAPLAPMRHWNWLPLDQMHALEIRLSIGDSTEENPMERREFLRACSLAGQRSIALAAGAAGLALSEPGKEVVDRRLTQKVTLAFKGTALSDLCDHLRTETGVYLSAGPSVADEKVTLFCKGIPLREVMRQLSRPFGYTWVRSGNVGEYKYELVQDLRSQLLEEELRNRERNASLLALEREIERYRPYLGLSPDEALARSKAVPPEEKKLLAQLSRYGWGPIQMYFRLSAQDLATLRSGQQLTFSQEPRSGEKPLPPDIARGVLQSFRELRLIKKDDRFDETWDLTDPRGLLFGAVPEVRAVVNLRMEQRELGQFALSGRSGAFIPRGQAGQAWSISNSEDPQAVGVSSTVLNLGNEAANAKLARDPALRRLATVDPQPSCPPASRTTVTLTADGAAPEPKVTSADVLEALHRATGMNIAADYYTRLHGSDTLSVRNLVLFDALNRLSDTMGLRWSKEQDWLQFRSTTFFNDRLKEVPNRLLSRWATARRKQGMLSLDDLVEIAQLTDTQLRAGSMAEGARECFGLVEWSLLHRPGDLRPHLRFLAGFTPAQRQKAMSATGLPFAEMPLAQQQRFLELALGANAEPLRSLEELAGAVLRVDYTPAGWFQFGEPGAGDAHRRWVVSLEPGPQGRRALVPLVRGRTREAALQALMQVDPPIREALMRSIQRADPRAEAVPPAWESLIHPTRLDLTVVYIPGMSNARPIRWVRPGQQLTGGDG
jgi:RNA polymerase sigma-70 factor (ECF subfamily)